MKSFRTNIYKALAAAIAALALSACETLDILGVTAFPDPSVTVFPIRRPPAPGYVRSGETFAGTVSWYSVRTNGGTKTASGEKFKDSGDTAAHLTLPFGTLVEVTNLANEETVVLRINDRGPFKKTRVLDVSIGAAKKLGFDKRGLTQCRIEVLKPARVNPVEEYGES